MTEPIRILIVEDLPTDAKLAEREISKEIKECVFEVVDTREDYLKSIASFSPDIIISDYRMPHFDGLSALNLALEHTPLTPLIMLTGSLNEDTAVACMKAGASDYVIKEHIKRLGQAVLRALEEKHVRKERLQAEIALRESEERFRSVYENATIGIYRTSPEGTILLANPAMVKMLGYDSFDDLAKENLEHGTIQSKHQRDKVREFLERDNIITGLDIILYKKDGQQLFARENSRAIRDQAGKLLYFDGTIEDITAEKLAEERIRHEAARAETLVRIAARLNISLDLQEALSAVCEETAKALNVPIVNIFLYDPDTETFKSAMAFGMEEEEYLSLPQFSRKMMALLNRKNLPFVVLPDFSVLLKILPISGIVQRDYRSVGLTLIQTGDQLIGALSVGNVGKTRDYSIDDQALLLGITDQAGMAISNASLYTQQKLVEEALRKSEARYRTVSDLTSDFTYALRIEPDNTFTSEWTTDAIIRITGRDWNPDVKTDSIWSNIVHPDDTLLVKEHMQTILSGKTHIAEFRVVDKNGEAHWLRDYSRPIWDDDEKRVTRIIGAAQDITKRKHVEEALRESETRYRTRSEELETLFALSTNLREAQTVEDMLAILIREMRRGISSDGGAIILLDEERQCFTISMSDGDLSPDEDLSFPLTEGASGQVYQTHQPFVTNDYSSDQIRVTKLETLEDCGPMICVPIQSEHEFIGVFTSTRQKTADVKPFSAGEIRLLSAMAEMAGNALRRARLFDDVQRHLRHTQALHDIQLTVASSFDLKVTLNVFLEHTISQLEVDAAAVFLLDPHTLTLEFAAGRGFHTYNVDRSSRRLGDGYAMKAALERKTICIPDLTEEDSEFSQSSFISKEGFVAFFGIPFIAKGQVKGVLEVYRRSPLQPDSDWMSFLETLAGQVAIAIDNLTLFKDLHNTNTQLTLAYDATIQGLSRALDLRDKETEGHTQRVAEMTVRLARAMGMMDSELVHVRRGALLHDMGKMGIPDSILLKPAALTDEEWEVMRRHPQYAFEMFSPIEYLRPALDIPYYHHEKWDGTGYPNGLKGDEIPLAARLFAVVDVWDALTSERPYRPAWSKEKALAYLKEQSAKHFDPRAVDMFFSILSQQDEEAGQYISELLS